jgi:hypothetical protein
MLSTHGLHVMMSSSSVTTCTPMCSSGRFFSLGEACDHTAALLGPLIGGHLASVSSLLPLWWMTALYGGVFVSIVWGYDTPLDKNITNSHSKVD